MLQPLPLLPRLPQLRLNNTVQIRLLKKTPVFLGSFFVIISHLTRNCGQIGETYFP